MKLFVVNISWMWEWDTIVVAAKLGKNAKELAIGASETYAAFKRLGDQTEYDDLPYIKVEKLKASVYGKTERILHIDHGSI